LIERLLKLNPEERLGNNLKSIKELKKHEFFKNINFEEVSMPDYKGAFT
jgi:hypothetical protein